MQIGVESFKAVDNKRVFVVDTCEITRAVLQFMLHDENETHEIQNLDDAYAKAADWKPDLILLGRQLLQELGSPVIGEIRRRIPGVRIAVVADSATDPVGQNALKDGAQSLLLRPLTVENVRRKVDVLLGRRTSLSIPVRIA